MEIFLAILLFAVGIVVVVKGADFFVSASSWVSDVTGISKILIGSTLVAIATSGPELFVSLIAAVEGKMDMSIGNVVGSHLCNLGLGFSLIAMFRPMPNKEKLFLPNGLIMILAAVLLFLFAFAGTLTIVHALIFSAIFALFTYINIRFSKQAEDMTVQLENQISVDQPTQTDSQLKKQKPQKKPTNKKEITINILKFVGGLAGIVLGSKLMVDQATVLARAMGVSEMFIGLTIVAIGTSLPEIVTTIVAIVKKEDDLGIGNIFGSCIFNNLFILAIATFVTGGLVFSDSVLIDMPVVIIMMLISVLPTIFKKKVYRWQGISLAVMYLGYMGYIIWTA